MIKKACYCLLFLIIFKVNTTAQTTLVPGDLAFISMRLGGGTDEVTVLTFVDICPTTVIYFIDFPYRNTGGFCAFNQEFAVSLTVTTKIPAGSKITYVEGNPGTFALSAGAGNIAYAFATAANQNVGFSTSGDNIFAMQGTFAAPTIITSLKTAAYTASGGVTCNNRAHTELPSTLALGVSALFKDLGSADCLKYTGTLTGAVATIKAAVFNNANWATAANTAVGAFTITGLPTVVCPAPLPINLLQFIAEPQNNSVVIYWETATEKNNDYFTIEKSLDGFTYIELKKVNSSAPNGNSTQKINYTMLDETPYTGISYYRLKQTDFDNKTETFYPVSVEFNTGKDIKITIMPNPNNGEFVVDYTGIENNHDMKLLMRDVLGKTVYQTEFNSKDYQNSITINPNPQLTSGIYYCTLVVEEINYIVKVIVE